MATTALPEIPPDASLGDLLRAWRQRRKLSQLALALKADVSQRHLSFIELGRARPSREMVLHLAEQLTLPLRDRNRLLVAAGHAPVFTERPLDHPALAAARGAVERVLTGHEPYPAIAVDRHWNLLAANRMFEPLFFDGAAPALLRPPVNVLRLTLHPQGLAPRIVNLHAWRAAVLAYLDHQAELSGDPVLGCLYLELRDYARSGDRSSARSALGADGGGVFIPLELETDGGVLALLSTVTMFSTPVDVTLAEIVLECFFPGDDASAERLRELATGSRSACTGQKVTSRSCNG